MYVKGHSDSAGPDSVGNNAADTLAVRGCDLAEEIEDDWDALRALVEEETNMIRELRVNGLTDAMGSDAGIAARGGQAGKPGRQMTVEVEEENVVKEITISKEEFDPRVRTPSHSDVSENVLDDAPLITLGSGWFRASQRR